MNIQETASLAFTKSMEELNENENMESLSLNRKSFIRQLMPQKSQSNMP